MEKVLITDYVHPVLINGLEEMGFQVDYQIETGMSELYDVIDQYTGIVINSKIKMYASIIDKASRLRFIARLGSGLEIIDVEYAKSKKISVINSPQGNRDAVAEHVIGMLLALNNKILSGDQAVRNEIWDREAHRGTELSGKTLGIIGLGHTGSQVAKRLSCWGMNILAYDKYVQNIPLNMDFVQLVKLDDILASSDIITLHLPLTEETNQLVNYAFLERCKDGVILCNTSRGEIVKTSDLIKALESGKLKGACLDVFENEKPKTYGDHEKKMYHKLFSFNNLVLSPHVAGWTYESLEKIALCILQKIKSENS
jgi:D-3-phosphoglycerate dehydrogenase / 2-oxoglutarate reductase